MVAYGHMSHVFVGFQLPLLAALITMSDDHILKPAGSLMRYGGRCPSLREL